MSLTYTGFLRPTIGGWPGRWPWRRQTWVWGNVHRHDDPMIDVAKRPPHDHGDESPQPSVHAHAAYAIRNTHTACAARGHHGAELARRLTPTTCRCTGFRVSGAVDDATEVSSRTGYVFSQEKAVCWYCSPRSRHDGMFVCFLGIAATLLPPPSYIAAANDGCPRQRCRRCGCSRHVWISAEATTTP
eukprot:gene7971-15211_t